MTDLLQLEAWSREDLKRVPELGPGRQAEVVECMRKFGVRLREE